MFCTKQTIIRTVVLLIALLNQILLFIGKNPLPFSEEGTYEAVSLVASVGASLWAWWKNNSFSMQAVEADRYLEALRSMKETEGAE